MAPAVAFRDSLTPAPLRGRLHPEQQTTRPKSPTTSASPTTPRNIAAAFIEQPTTPASPTTPRNIAAAFPEHHSIQNTRDAALAAGWRIARDGGWIYAPLKPWGDGESDRWPRSPRSPGLKALSEIGKEKAKGAVGADKSPASEKEQVLNSSKNDDGVVAAKVEVGAANGDDDCNVDTAGKMEVGSHSSEELHRKRHSTKEKSDDYIATAEAIVDAYVNADADASAALGNGEQYLRDDGSSVPKQTTQQTRSHSQSSSGEPSFPKLQNRITQRPPKKKPSMENILRRRSKKRQSTQNFSLPRPLKRKMLRDQVLHKDLNKTPPPVPLKSPRRMPSINNVENEFGNALEQERECKNKTVQKFTGQVRSSPILRGQAISGLLFVVLLACIYTFGAILTPIAICSTPSPAFHQHENGRIPRYSTSQGPEICFVREAASTNKLAVTGMEGCRAIENAEAFHAARETKAAEIAELIRTLEKIKAAWDTDAVQSLENDRYLDDQSDRGSLVEHHVQTDVSRHGTVQSLKDDESLESQRALKSPSKPSTQKDSQSHVLGSEEDTVTTSFPEEHGSSRFRVSSKMVLASKILKSYWRLTLLSGRSKVRSSSASSFECAVAKDIIQDSRRRE